MPGLIDAHVHVYSAFINYAHIADMPHTLMAIHATRRLREILDRGFTTVRDVAGGDFGVKRAVEQGLIAGPRLFIAGRAMSMTGGHGDQRKLTESDVPCACGGGHNALEIMTAIVDGVPEMRRAVRNELRKGADHIKLLVSGGVGSPYDPLHGRQFSEEEVRAAVDEAAAWDKYVCAHSYTSRSTRFAVECGVRTIEHGNLIDEGTARLMAEKKCLHGAYARSLCGDGETGQRAGPVRRGHGQVAAGQRWRPAHAGDLPPAGVEMGFGTDLMGELNEAQSEEFLIRSRVLPNVEILKSATSVNARILQQENRLGVIAAGSPGRPARDRRQPSGEPGSAAGAGSSPAGHHEEWSFPQERIVSGRVAHQVGDQLYHEVVGLPDAQPGRKRLRNVSKWRPVCSDPAPT